MSISTEIARLQGLKGRQKTKVVELGLGSPVTLEAITTAIEGIEKQGAVIKEISAKAEEAEIPAGYHDGTGKVTIAAKEQAKIIPENIKAGITILGEEGTYSGEGAKMQTKTATPTKQAQSITPDMGYDGLSNPR